MKDKWYLAEKIRGNDLKLSNQVNLSDKEKTAIWDILNLNKFEKPLVAYTFDAFESDHTKGTDNVTLFGLSLLNFSSGVIGSPHIQWL